MIRPVDRQASSSRINVECDFGRIAIDRGQHSTLNRQTVGVIFLQHPVASRGDTDWDDLVNLRTQGPQNAPGTNTGDVMLTASATEDHRNANPVHPQTVSAGLLVD